MYIYIYTVTNIYIYIYIYCHEWKQQTAYPRVNIFQVNSKKTRTTLSKPFLFLSLSSSNRVQI